ncbi:2'-5' RNA ligase superfamily protein [Actinacidiphila alni]|uniref:2'-5' RNA ligase superfamily protein n=1 Tax=Actinacidiphila alni TaxID=380248 RepID=A0A1I2L6P5_9ACTN|nr:2'-5' RNA ligase family protein [Actinacidiphila alni]SFF74992.1 2'-5' RNA ligase superfamily protein [Actinacidiphila alni]
MINHWDRPGWTSTTRAYYWLIPIATKALADQAEQSQQALAGMGFDPIDRTGLHLTLGRIGLAEDITDQHLTQLIECSAKGLPPAATAHAIPMAGSRGAVRYSLAPWTPVLRLHQYLDTAVRATGLRGLGPTARLRPHIGIAYSHRVQDAGPVQAAVEALRCLPAMPVRVDRAVLVLQRREPGAYRWDVLHELLLPEA